MVGAMTEEEHEEMNAWFDARDAQIDWVSELDNIFADMSATVEQARVARAVAFEIIKAIEHIKRGNK